jgi:serine/threonine protein kinase
MMPMPLRQFELRSFVASGGNGTVYRGWDTVLERLVAVKLLKKESLQDPKALESFYREARACAASTTRTSSTSTRSTNGKGLRYLVMELADRGSLDTRIDKASSRG